MRLSELISIYEINKKIEKEKRRKKNEKYKKRTQHIHLPTLQNLHKCPKYKYGESLCNVYLYHFLNY
jgi:hypothetical protein